MKVLEFESISKDSNPRDGAGCGTTSDGAAYCAVPAKREPVRTAQPNNGKPPAAPRKIGLKKAAGVALAAIACALSPCCAVLWVPFAISALAAGPAAVWVGANTGIVYGIATGLAVASAVLAVLLLRQGWFAKKRGGTSPVGRPGRSPKGRAT